MDMRPCANAIGAALLGLLMLAGCGSSGQNTPVVTAEAPPAPPAAPEKIKINSLDELPVHTYPLQGTPTEMLADPQIMSNLQQAVLADIESDLNTYLIEDVTTLQGKHQNLATLAMADGDNETALHHLDIVTGLEDKEAAISEAKSLQTQWQKSGSLWRSKENELWQQFREPLDPLFAELKTEQDEHRAATEERLRRRRKEHPFRHGMR